MSEVSDVAAPGTLASKLSETPSFGCTRITRVFGCSASWASPPNMRCGGVRNCTAISEYRLASRLPERSRKGTPFQRQLSMYTRIAAYVGVTDSGDTSGSSRYAGNTVPFASPTAYCARTVFSEIVCDVC